MYNRAIRLGTDREEMREPHGLLEFALEGRVPVVPLPVPVDEFLSRDLDLLVTVCGSAKESCPVFSSRVGRRLHWPFDDPAGATGSKKEVLAEFRRVRDEIRLRVEAFVQEGEPDRSAA